MGLSVLVYSEVACSVLLYDIQSEVCSGRMAIHVDPLKDAWGAFGDSLEVVEHVDCDGGLDDAFVVVAAEVPSEVEEDDGAFDVVVAGQQEVV